jgi:signal transduction histidine kinase
MFKSARIKLTFFYLTAIFIVTFLTTFGTRILAQDTFESTNSGTRGGIRSFIQSEVGLPILENPIKRIQDKQDSEIHGRLLAYTIYIDFLVLMIGGPLSYWFAGRTLKPIEDAHDSQTKFASDASHELKTPLSVMRTENEVFLRQKSFTEAEARSQIVSNLDEIQRLELLTNNLLLLSDFGKTEKIKLSNIKSSQVSKAALDHVSKVFKSELKRVKVEVDNSEIYGNLESLSQIIFIFLDNAIKYSPKQSEIRLVGKSIGQNYQFSVIDKGPGVNKDDMPLIFERLYRGDKNRSKKIPGHGLGLALAKEIAEANQAGLTVANNVSGGACFSLLVNKSSDSKIN